MKEQDKEREDIISRRQFFKRAAGAALPFLAMTMLPSALTSCEIDDPDNPYIGGVPEGTGKSGGCTSCTGKCSKACANNCVGTCRVTCTTGCKVYCQGSCGNSNCRSECRSGCKGACYQSCSGSCSKSSSGGRG